MCGVSKRESKYKHKHIGEEILLTFTCSCMEIKSKVIKWSDGEC